MVFDTDYGESTAAGVLTSAPSSARVGDEGEGGVGNELTPTALPLLLGRGRILNITVFWISTGCAHCILIKMFERGNGIKNSWLDLLNP